MTMATENAIFYAAILSGIIAVLLMWAYGERCEKQAKRAERKRRNETVVEIPFEEIIRLIWEAKRK